MSLQYRIGLIAWSIPVFFALCIWGHTIGAFPVWLDRYAARLVKWLDDMDRRMGF